jgi:hypothetical protein
MHGNDLSLVLVTGQELKASAEDMGAGGTCEEV